MNCCAGIMQRLESEVVCSRAITIRSSRSSIGLMLFRSAEALIL